jgi:hypothetical protein
MVYQDLPVEQARQIFDEIKGTPPPPTEEKKVPVPVKRKLRIVTKDK